MSKREFISCPLYERDVPVEDCSSCEYNTVTRAGINRCGFCLISSRNKSSLSEKVDILDEYDFSEE